MDLSEKIYHFLTKRKYNRGKPYLDEKLKEVIEESVAKNNPIKLIGFWGTGPKSKLNWADEESSKFLNDLNNEIKTIYPSGLEYTFIFADMHGLHNGYLKEDIDSYILDIRKLFDKYSFKSLELNALWDKHGITFEKINSIFNSKPDGWWDETSQRETIERNAKNRNKKGSPEIEAQKYFIMRELEKEMFLKEFPSYIFNAFSDPELQVVLPDMPTLYFYAREGWSNAPWFVDFDKK